jgi:hypothetical protein
LPVSSDLRIRWCWKTLRYKFNESASLTYGPNFVRPPDFNSSARAQIGGGVVSPTHSHLGTGRKWAITPRHGRFAPGCDAVPIVQEAGWAPGPVWTAQTRCHRISIPGPYSPWRFAVPTELSRPALRLKEVKAVGLFFTCV